MPRSKYLPPGETRTLKKIAEDSGISVNLLYQRLRNGKSLDEATLPCRTRSRYLPPGETRTLKEIARDNGISFSIFTQRLYAGKSFEEATLPSLEKRSKYLPEGETRTLSQLARDNGMTYQAVLARIHRGIPVLRAIDPAKLKPRSKFIPEGETRTLGELAEESGFSKGAIINRLKSGMSVSDAISTPHRRQRRAVGKYESLSALAKVAGISRERVRQLVNMGVDPEAIASGKRPRGSAAKDFPETPKKYQGKGIKAVAKAWKIPYYKAQKLYHEGLTFEQARKKSKTFGPKIVLPGTPKKYKGKSLQAIAEDLGVTYSKLYNSYLRGYSYKEAKKRAKRTRAILPGTPKKYEGKSLHAISKDLGVSYSRLHYYYSRGYTYKEARKRLLAKKKKK